MQFQRVTHVIFDMDGLLLDTERLYTIGFKNFFSKYGKEYTWELKAKLMGKQSIEGAEICIKTLDLPLTVEEFLEEKLKHVDVLFSNAALMPGARRLMEHLHDTKVPFALGTSSSESAAALKMKNHQQFFSKFSHFVFGTSDPEVKKGKPDPDIFLVCASKFTDKPQPKDCLVFEDAPNGVMAALSAGMQVVMVPDEELDKCFTRDATQVLTSLENFQPELFGLPPFKD